jgi:hypothetical protein
MNTKKTLVLAAVLGLAVLYLTKVMMPQREHKAGEKMAFAKLQASDIGSIDIAQSAAGESSVKRYAVVREPAPEKAGAAKIDRAGEDTSQTGKPDDGIWSLSGVRGALIDSGALERFVSGLRELTVEGPLDERDRYSDLSVYGLSKPELTTVVHERSGRDTEVAFGKLNQYLSKRYVKVSGRDGVFLADESSFDALNKGSSDLRSKTPFRFNSSDARAVLLTSSQGRIELQQTAVGEWKITHPAEYRASNEDVEALLSAIHEITVGEFIDGQYDNRQSYGFGFPRLSVIVQFREGIAPDQVSFSLANVNARGGGEQEMYFLSSNSDTIFKLAADPSAALVKRLDDLRYKRVVEMPHTSMQKVVSTAADGASVTIVAAGTGWTVNEKQGDPMFVDQLLRDIASLKAVRFPESVPEDAFGKPSVVLVISAKEADKAPVTITVGKEFTADTGEILRYVRSSASDTVFGIRDVEAKRIVPHEEALLPAKTPEPAKS